MAKQVLTQNLSEPLLETKTARFDIYSGVGNLIIDRLASSEGLLASGKLEYLEKQDTPAWTVDTREGQATLTLKASGGRQQGFRLPWASCNGENNWQIHLNPLVSSDITARSGGGNLKINLAGMAVTRVFADSGGGNLDMVLPDCASEMSVTARTGGGNVSVELGNDIVGSNFVTATSGAGRVLIQVPSGVAARIYASTGMGKVIINSRYKQFDKHSYQSPDYDSAVDRVEIDARSGAGNISIITK